MCSGTMWVLLPLICTSVIRGCVLCVGAAWRLPGQSQQGSSVEIRVNRTRAASGGLSDIVSCLPDRAVRNVVSHTRPLFWVPPSTPHFGLVYPPHNAQRNFLCQNHLCVFFVWFWNDFDPKWLRRLMNIQQYVMSKHSWCNKARSWRCAPLKPSQSLLCHTALSLPLTSW